MTLNANDVAGLGTAAVKDYGTAAGQLVPLDASARLPAIDGSQLLNVNATLLASRAVASTAPNANEVLTWNNTSLAWEPRAVPSAAVTSVAGRVGAVVIDAGDVTSAVGKYFTYQPNGVACATNETMKWDGTRWLCAADSDSGGDITSVIAGTGLLGGGLTGAVSLAVDVGTAAGKLLQLNGSAQIPAVDGSLLTKLNAVALQTRAVSAVAPSAGQVLKWNAVDLMWEPAADSDLGITALSGDVVATGPGAAVATIQANAIGSSKINSTGIAINRLLITDATTGTTVKYADTCAVGEILKWSPTGWSCAADAGGSGFVTSIASGTGLLGGPITTTGTLSVDTGTTANKILQLNASAQIPAVDGSLLTNVNAVRLQARAVSSVAPTAGQTLSYNATSTQWEPSSPTGGTVTSIATGNGLLGGTITATGTLAVDAGTGANKILQLNAGAQIPAVDGSQLTQINAVALQTRAVASTAPTAGQVLGWNQTSLQWEPVSAATGSVTNIATGVGLTGGPITSAGTLNVDVGTAAGKIVQENANAQIAQSLGSAALPSFTFAGNTNTGLYSPGANTLSLATNGTAALNIAANGAVGLGTSAPTERLHIEGTGSPAIRISNTAGPSSVYVTATAGGGTLNTAQGPLSLQTLGSTRVIIDSSGNVGIGTAVPASVLDVFAVGTTSAILIPRDVAGNRPAGVNGMLRYNTSANAFEGFANGNWATIAAGSAAGTITNIASGTGLLGGPITTTGTLSVDVGTAANKIVQENAGAQIAQSSGTALAPSYSFGADTASGLYSPAAGQLALSTSGTAALTILNNGRVGIGTNAPTQTLSVVGNTSLNGTLSVLGGTTSGTRGVAIGNGAVASGPDGVAFQSGTGYGQLSFAIGYNTHANNTQAFAGGNNTYANGMNSLAFGNGPVSNGGNSVAFGEATIAPAYAETVIGAYNGTTGAENANTPVATDPAFVVGNGNAGLRSNALILLRNGNLGLGVNYPLAALDITATGSSSAILIPRDIAGNRPTGVNGMLRYNTSSNAFEGFANGGWATIAAGASAGTVTNIASGTGLTGGPITTTGTLSVDVGTAANKIVQENANAQIAQSSGSVTTPAFSFATNTNTGVYSPGANQLGVSINGTAALTFSANGDAYFLSNSTSGNYTSGAVRINGGLGVGGQISANTNVVSPQFSAYTANGNTYAPTSSSVTSPNGVGYQRFNTSVGDGRMAIDTYNVTNMNGIGQNAYSGIISTSAGFSPAFVWGQRSGATAYAERMRLDENGNLGVGTAAPLAALDITATGSASAILIPRDVAGNRPTGVNGMLRYNTSANNFEGFANGGWATIAAGTSAGTVTSIASGTGLLGGPITSNGTLSVDVGSAATKIPRLNASAQLALLSGSSSAPTYGFAADATTGMSLASTGNLAFSASGTASMTLAGGRLGIGTTAMDHTLDVWGANTAYSLAALTDTTATAQDVGATLQLKGMDGSSDRSFATIKGGKQNNVSGNYDGYFSVLTRSYSDNGNSEKMRVTAQGLLGLGTTAPAALLDVYGTGPQSAILIPRDSTTNRPGGVNGMLRYNTTSGAFEGYAAGTWASFSTGGGGGAGTVTSLATGNGLLGGPVTTTGTLTVDAGTAANKIVQLNSNAQIGLQRGTAALPAYAFAGSPNTGLYSPGTSSLALSANGAAAMTIQSNGFIGIGTPTPNFPLDVTGDLHSSNFYTGDAFITHTFGQATSATSPAFAFVYGGGTGMFQPSAGSNILGFTTNGNERLRIDATGNVAIGATSPLAILDVNAAGTNSAIIVPRDTTGNRPTGVNGMIRYNTTANAMEGFVNGTWSSFSTGAGGGITSLATGTGLLGGPITASGTLTVDVGTSANKIVQENAGSQIAQGNGTVALPSYSFGASASTGLYSPGANSLALATNGTAALNILSSGFVGIGTNAPGGNLEVRGGTSTGPGASILVTSPLDNAVGSVQVILKTSNHEVDLALGPPNGFGNFNNKFFFNDNVGGVRWVTDTQTGNFGIGNMTPQSRLDVTGGVGVGTYAGVTSAPSNGLIVSGSVGVGTATPAAKLTVFDSTTNGVVTPLIVAANAGTGPSQFVNIAIDNQASGGYKSGISFRNNGVDKMGLYTDVVGSGANNFAIYDNVAGAARLLVDAAGNVGIGTAVPGYPLEVNGTVKATSFLSPSDRRLKGNIQTMGGLTVVRKLRGVSFAWKNTGEPDAGVIAQELEEVLPFLVATDAQSGFKAVKYASLISPLIEATKELDVRCEANEAKIGAVDRRLATVEADVDTLKADNQKLRDENQQLKERLDKIERALNLK